MNCIATFGCNLYEQSDSTDTLSVILEQMMIFWVQIIVF